MNRKDLIIYIIDIRYSIYKKEHACQSSVQLNHIFSNNMEQMYVCIHGWFDIHTELC